MSETFLTIEVADYIATLTLARPPVNALNAGLRDALVAAFDAISDRDDVRVVILTGSGKVFCAGADLKDRPDTSIAGSFGRHNRLVRETSNSIRECSKPVIAAVNGAALGAGFGLVAACDIIVASETAVFGMPEIDVGLAGGAASLKSLLGRSRLRFMLYTGARLPASEFYRTGVIEACTPPEELMGTATEIARTIAGKSPRGISYAKVSANMVDLMPLRDAYRFEQNFTVELAKSRGGASLQKSTKESEQ